MAASAGDILYYPGDIVEFEVATGETIVKGDPVYINDEDEITKAVNDDVAPIGVAIGAGVEGTRVEVIIHAPVIYMTVGTGGVTAGSYVEVGTDGVIDFVVASALALQYALGISWETETTQGEVVPVQLMPAMVQESTT